MRIIYKLVKNYSNYFDYKIPDPTENLILHWIWSCPAQIGTNQEQSHPQETIKMCLMQCRLTCRSSSANCAVPFVTESTESDKELGTDRWAKTEAHNMVNNTPEIKRHFIKYLNSLHIGVFRWKGVNISKSENVCSPWDTRNNWPKHLKNLIFILLKRMIKFTIVILWDS